MNLLVFFLMVGSFMMKYIRKMDCRTRERFMMVAKVKRPVRGFSLKQLK